jgi:hypothetical protein
MKGEHLASSQHLDSRAVPSAGKLSGFLLFMFLTVLWDFGFSLPFPSPNLLCIPQCCELTMGRAFTVLGTFSYQIAWGACFVPGFCEGPGTTARNQTGRVRYLLVLTFWALCSPGLQPDCRVQENTQRFPEEALR